LGEGALLGQVRAIGFPSLQPLKPKLSPLGPDVPMLSAQVHLHFHCSRKQAKEKKDGRRTRIEQRFADIVVVVAVAVESLAGADDRLMRPVAVECPEEAVGGPRIMLEKPPKRDLSIQRPIMRVRTKRRRPMLLGGFEQCPPRMI